MNTSQTYDTSTKMKKMNGLEKVNNIEGNNVKLGEGNNVKLGEGSNVKLGEGSKSPDNYELRVTNSEKRDLGPIKDSPTIKESIVTIDTTDKRSHRAQRAQHTYAAKKTVAQGMMDVALITANANQLRYLVEYQRNSPTFFVNVFLIVVSLLLQIGVGVSLIFKGRYDIQGKGKSPQAQKINNYVVVGVFLITIINVFVAAFSVSVAPASTPSSVPAIPVLQTSP